MPRRSSFDNGAPDLSPSARRLIEELAVKHRVAISPNDPLARLQTVNEHLIREAHQSLQASIEVALQNLQSAIDGGAQNVSRAASEVAIDTIKRGGITAAPDPELRRLMNELQVEVRSIKVELATLLDAIHNLARQGASKTNHKAILLYGSLGLLCVIVCSSLVTQWFMYSIQ